MARTTDSIKKEIGASFLAQDGVRAFYAIEKGKSFSQAFSPVSLESLLLYAVAAAIHVLEVLFDTLRGEVEDRAANAIVGSVPYYHRMAMNYQHGDALIYNEKTYAYGYPISDDTKRVVKFAAVRDLGTSIQVLVSGREGGRPSILPNDTLDAFRAYMNLIKMAGVVLEVYSYNADRLKIRAKVQLDPLIFNANGSRIRDNVRAVEVAVQNYLDGITYGGVFNKTRLVDALQMVEGVVDVELGECSYSIDGTNYHTITGNNFSSVGGSFVSQDLTNTITYVQS